MQIYLIRHGSTAGNLEHRYVGTTDEPLTDAAEEQLKERRAFYPVPDTVFASPMKRCIQTARLLFPEAEIRVLPGLRECAFGEFEYKNFQELQQDARYQAWIDSGGTLAFPGGESRREFAGRCCAAFQEGCLQALRQGCESAAFVVHGGTIMAVLDRFSRPHKDYFDWQVKNAEGFAGELDADAVHAECGKAEKKADAVHAEYGKTEKKADAVYAEYGKIEKKADAVHAEYGKIEKKADAVHAECGKTEKITDGEDPSERKGAQKRQFEVRALRHLPEYPDKEQGENSQNTGKTTADFSKVIQPKMVQDISFRTGVEDLYVMKQNKKLRCGYTTGSCAAAAAKAAAEMLLTGRGCRKVELMTPKGVLLHLPTEDRQIGPDWASCAVRKFAGDDPDATDGILIYARAELVPAGSQKQEAGDKKKHAEQAEKDSGRKEDNDRQTVQESGNIEPEPASSDSARIILDGGIGVGRVTKPGLEQPVGAAAINRVPRAMITQAVEEICEMQEYRGRVKIIISVPEGEEIAKKTFNPHIGILGGISILGTSGIVVPMSEEALIASIRLEMKQKYANGERLLLITPGNYGADFLRKKELSCALDVEHSMKCSNYVGETVDMAVELGFEGILFVAHIGKFIKVSGGIMNTHSAHADCRAELIAAQMLRAAERTEPEQPDSDEKAVRSILSDKRAVCAGQRMSPDRRAMLAGRLLATNTTEEAVDLLREAGVLEATMREVTERIKFHLQKRCRGAIRTEAVIYSNQSGYLGETDGAEAMMEQMAAVGV